jgi:3'-5' exoribonuclease
MPLARRRELVRAAIDAIGHVELASLVRWTFAEDGVLGRFLDVPAAKRHHSARVGGLAVHTLNVSSIALDLARHATVPVDLDLLRAGALLHDIGKIDELAVTVETGLLPGYTAGHLQGHVALAIRRIERAAVCCGFESSCSIDRLVHLVVSHHGSPEWGAPERPMTIEAIILHQADMGASRIEGACEAISSAPPDAEWTDYAPMFEERLYVGA